MSVLLAAPVGLAHAAAGDLDPSFDGDGKTTLGYDVARTALMQPDGKIVVAGYGGPDHDFKVSRLNADGSLDGTFNGGTAGADFGDNDLASAAALQADDNIALARLQADLPRSAGPGPGSSPAPRCAGRRATIVGTARRDVLRGTRRADVIVGRGGSDVITGARGNDRLLGESGRDRLTGGKGRDNCLGGGGRDRASCENKRSA